MRRIARIMWFAKTPNTPSHILMTKLTNKQTNINKWKREHTQTMADIRIHFYDWKWMGSLYAMEKRKQKNVEETSTFVHINRAFIHTYMWFYHRLIDKSMTNRSTIGQTCIHDRFAKTIRFSFIDSAMRSFPVHFDCEWVFCCDLFAYRLVYGQ